MPTIVSVAEAKAHLSELIEKAEAGEEIVITRRGKPVAHMHAAKKPKEPLPDLTEFRASLGIPKGAAGKALRKMRKEYRY